VGAKKNHAFAPKNIVILSAMKWSEKSFCLKGKFSPLILVRKMAFDKLRHAFAPIKKTPKQNKPQ